MEISCWNAIMMVNESDSTIHDQHMDQEDPLDPYRQ